MKVLPKFISLIHIEPKGFLLRNQMASSVQVPTKYASISHNMYANHNTNSDKELETEGFKGIKIKPCNK